MAAEFVFPREDGDLRGWFSTTVDWNPKDKESPGYEFAAELVAELLGEDDGEGWDHDAWNYDEWGECRRIADDAVYRLESRGTWGLIQTWADLWNGGPSISEDNEILRGPADAEVDLPAIMARDLAASAIPFLQHIGEQVATAYEAHLEEQALAEDDQE